MNLHVSCGQRNDVSERISMSLVQFIESLILTDSRRYSDGTRVDRNEIRNA